MSRTFWLSFSGDAGNLGVCVIDVTDADVEATPPPPNPAPLAHWFAAAIRLSWLYECNPGGSVGIIEIPPDHPVPRHRLLRGEELEQWATKDTGVH